jgi:predicted PurR-regulated permease PerM
MKNSPLTTILLALLAVSAALSVLFFLMYNSKLRELRDLQFQVTQINQRSAAINQLMNEVLEYSKKSPNHDIDRLLESFGLTNRPAAVK